MFEKIKEFVKNSKLAQFALVLLLGMFIGAVFYPTKHIEEKMTIKHEEETRILKEQHSKELSKVQEEYSKTASEYKQYKSDSEYKLTKLTTEVHNLKSKQKTSYYKLIKPDGTIEVRKYSESEVDESTKVVTQIQEEFKQKIEAVETKWEEIHKKRVTEIKKEFSSKEEEYKKTIDELTKSKVVDINKKSFGVEAGALLNGSYYGHVTYDVFGPFLLGLHSQLGPSPTAGAGPGIRF